MRPLFIESGGRRIFLLLRVPERPVGCVLLVPPFAEEMNKSRRQITETATELARSGYASLVVDLSGTGDSEGEFADASWRRWVDDICDAISWAESQGLVVDATIAVRLGCALVAESLQKSGHAVKCSVFWQPVASGGKAMTQFLRLRVAASMMGDDLKETVEGLKARLKSGESLEIGGYELSSRLWQQIEAIKLSDKVSTALGSLSILEISRIESDQVSNAGRRLIDASMANGITTSGLRIAGDPFWSSTEIVTNPNLAALSVSIVKKNAF